MNLFQTFLAWLNAPDTTPVDWMSKREDYYDGQL